MDFGLAFLLIVLGLGFFGAVYLLLGARLRQRREARPVPAAGALSLAGDPLLPDHQEAVLIVESGGRIKAINPRARQVFHLQEDELPNLERLAQKTRPSESLIRLCAVEGQARFALEGRLVEGTSYHIPDGSQPSTVISLRYPEAENSITGGQVDLVAQSLQTFTRLAEAMVASLDLEDTISAILKNIETLIPGDMDLMELAIWDVASESFIPYRLEGLPRTDRKLSLVGERYPAARGLIGRLCQSREPVLILDIDNEQRQPAEIFPVPMRTYMGFPLMVGSELIGALILGSLTAGALREEDLALVSLLSGQAAVAVHNALLYRAEEQRTAELSGLARLGQAFGSVRDPSGLFIRLVESIAPLVKTEMVGFLIYNEASRVLEARVPFHGLPEPFVELYRIEIPVNSITEKILLEQDVLITEDAIQDEQWARLGLDHFAQAASMHETVLVPLAVGGHMLGYLQASNHHGGQSPFSQAELHLLMIVANQTASMIENASLVQQSRLRAQRAESLRRITSLISSSASLEEILRYSIQEMAHLHSAEVGAVFLIDPQGIEINLHRASVFGSLPDLPEKLVHLRLDDPQYPFTVTGSQHSLFLAQITQPERPIIPFYQAIFTHWGVSSAIALPLVVRDEGVGEVWFASRTETFEQGDLLVSATAVGQLAGAVEQSRLRGQTDESLRRRVDQMTAITRISRELSTSLDLNSLLDLVYDESLRTTRADCGTILLLDKDESPAERTRIQFFVGDMPGAALPDLERAVLVSNAPVIVVDFASSPYLPPHPGIQSALVVPISRQNRIEGLICLHGNVTGQFDETAVEILQSLAVQAAVALNNARLYQASEQRANQLQVLTQVAGTITSSLQRSALIETLLGQLKMVVPYDTATLWLRSGGTLTVAEAAGFTDNESRMNLSVDVQDSALFQEMDHSGAPIVVGDVRTDPRFPSLTEPDNLSWLGIPLIYKSELIGLIALEKREAGFYSKDYISAATTFASQAAVSLENARLYEESTQRAAELNDRSERMALLNRLSGELVASFDTDYIFHLTGQELRRALDAAGAAVVMIEKDNQYLLQGETPAREVDQPLALPASPLFERLRASHGIFQTSDAAADSELQSLWRSFLRPRGATSLLMVPLVSGSALLGWFLIYQTRERRYGPAEIELSRTICNQSAIAIQNARLFAETSRLASNLEQRVEQRTREVVHEHQNSQTLLRIITELSASLDVGLVLNRTLSVLNDSIGCEESMIILSQEGSAPYHAGLSLDCLEDGPDSVEHQIAHWVARSHQPVLADQVQADGRWKMPVDAAPGYQSVLAVPLIMGEEALGALLLFHRAAGIFTQEQIGLMEATARQIGIALNNAELYNLIRDQSQHLGHLLREQQIEASRSRAILEAVADGVVVTNPQTRVSLFNASAERILNLKSSLLMGKSLDESQGLFGKAALDWLTTIRIWSGDPTLSLNAENFYEKLALDNGSIISVNLAPVFWRQEFIGTVSIFRDITHEVQVDRLKSEFVANVSHELRTPMTSIKGYVEIMLMGASGELTPQQAHFLNIVKSNTERLMVLVNDLLDISRIESGRVALDIQPMDVRAIAEEVLADFQQRSREENRPMRFDLQSPAELPLAQGDAERIRQVLTSLVSNGYTYTPDNGCIQVRIQHCQDEIQIDVQDNGIGIGLEAQHRIFERFYRGDDPLVLASSGTGLGLAIAKALIEMHHGRIWFESSGVRGKGSIFSITLPVSNHQERGV